MKKTTGEGTLTPKQLFSRGTIIRLARQYVEECKREDDAGGGGQFPNLAGFACRLCIGLEALETLGKRYPKRYDELLAILEDGALNTAHIPAKSALLTVDYFRHRLGYGGKNSKERAEDGAICVSFDHNIAEDGK